MPRLRTNACGGKASGPPFDVPSVNPRRLLFVHISALLVLLVGVAAFQTASTDRIDGSREIARFVLFLAILLVVVEVGFVFLPGHRAIRLTIDTLRVRIAGLDDVRLRQRALIDDLARRNVAIRAASDVATAAVKEGECLRREQAQFTAAVSHDLKSPANTIHLLLEEFRLDHDDALDAEGKQMIDDALGTVRRMRDLIEDVLTDSWLTATGTGTPPETFDMGACIDEVLADLAGDIRAAGAKVFRGPGIAVTGHRSHLRILAQNLIANAIKFHAPGTAPEVRIACLATEVPGTWRLVVRDDGIGIPSEHQARIFDPFGRLHVREAYPGTGLGLATCRRIVDGHRGRITLISDTGAGSTFDVTLAVPARGDAGDDVTNDADRTPEIDMPFVTRTGCTAQGARAA